MSIEHTRQQTYPGSDIVLHQNLVPGPNYDRYVASYESEGLTIYALLSVPSGERPGKGRTRQLGGPPLGRNGLFAFATLDENPEFWMSVDPITYLEDLSGPIQIHHVTGDQSVPVEWSQSLHDRLREAGQTSDLYVYQGTTTTSRPTSARRCGARWPSSTST